MSIIQGKGASIMEFQLIPEDKGLTAKCIHPRRKDYMLGSFNKS